MSDASQVAAALQAALRTLSQGRFAAARDACLQILRGSPDEAGALHLLGVIALRDGEHRAAEDFLRRAAESPDTNALYLLSYAELCRRATDPAAAVAMTRRALAMDGQLVLGWFSLGSQLLEARQYAESKSCFERTLQLDPRFWRASSQIAVVLGRLGHTAEAFERFQRLLSDQADSGEAIAQYAAFLQDLGHFTDALIHIERAISKSPDSLDHHLRAADIEMQLGRFAAVLDRLRAVEHRWPDDIKLLVYLATVLRLVDRYDEAVVLCRGAFARGLESADLERAYGLALQSTGEALEALRMFDRAAAVRPALALSDKAVLLGQLGQLSEACRTFDQALSHEPALAEVWYNRTNAKTYGAADPDIDTMQGLLEAGCSYRDRMLLHFALGKAHMDANDVDAAFANWHSGNRMKRALIDYDADATAQELASIATASSEFAAADRITGARLSDLPVFVVGMPRSGSSLVEQIIASHPDVHGSGEQTGLRELFAAKCFDFEGPHDDERSAETALQVLRRHAPRAVRVIDKDLGNFKYLGVIHRIFPHARIIHCRRDALDTGFSAYTKLFLGDFPFTYDLREMGRYYRNYRSLMEHWRGMLPSQNLMDVDYETLVTEPDETTRRLVDFLGLPWNDACLRFFETRRVVSSASFAQVRQPIYRSSVGRSTSVLSYLQPLAEALGTPAPLAAG
jgi:tetratricopeptide (TPR) repeat protein